MSLVLKGERQKAMISILKEQITIFSQTHDNMKGIDLKVTTHKLNVDSKANMLSKKERETERERKIAQKGKKVL